MKATKIILISIAVCTGIFFLTACKSLCETNKPANISPIDWDNYNDVYTVNWNFRSNDCSTVGHIGTIKVYGWVYGSNLPIRLYTKPVQNNDEVNNTLSIGISTHTIADEIKEKLDTIDFTRKCYIQGELYIDCEVGGSFGCSHSAYPFIKLLSIDDIYFETNKIDNDE